MTIYVVQAAGDDDTALTRARFIPQGFSWPAFVYAQVWLAYHRLWIALVVWIAVEVAVFVVIVPHATGATTIGVALLAHVFIGLEGNRLRQSKGARHAVVTDLVEARDRGEQLLIEPGTRAFRSAEEQRQRLKPDGRERDVADGTQPQPDRRLGAALVRQVEGRYGGGRGQVFDIGNLDRQELHRVSGAEFAMGLIFGAEQAPHARCRAAG